MNDGRSNAADATGTAVGAMRLRRRAGWTRVGAWTLGIVLLALTASGVLLYLLNPADPAAADWSDAAHGWQRAASVLHGVFAWVFCIALGRWVWPHIALVWARTPRRRVWMLGLASAAVGALTASSGLALLYGAADWRGALSDTHWATGLAWPALCIAHGWRPLARALRGR